MIAVAASSHPGHEHKILGTATMAASDRLMLKDKDDEDVTFHITSDKVVKDKKEMKVEGIKSGMRVVVTAVTENEKVIAKPIELGTTPETT
jgi:phosphopantetheine adenylyltransferase